MMSKKSVSYILDQHEILEKKIILTSRHVHFADTLLPFSLPYLLPIKAVDSNKLNQFDLLKPIIINDGYFLAKQFVKCYKGLNKNFIFDCDVVKQLGISKKVSSYRFEGNKRLSPRKKSKVYFIFSKDYSLYFYDWIQEELERALLFLADEDLLPRIEIKIILEGEFQATKFFRSKKKSDQLEKIFKRIKKNIAYEVVSFSSLRLISDFSDSYFVEFNNKMLLANTFTQHYFLSRQAERLYYRPVTITKPTVEIPMSLHHKVQIFEQENNLKRIDNYKKYEPMKSLSQLF